MVALLNAISSFSLLRGVLSPEKICTLAHQSGYTALCITDRNNLYGLPSFLTVCKRLGMKAIVGAEITGPDDRESVLVYADGETGYANLCRIISARQMEKRFYLCEVLKRHAKDITVVTGSHETAQKLKDTTSVYFRIERLTRIPTWVKKIGIGSLIVPLCAFEHKEDCRTHLLLQAIGDHTTLSRVDSDHCITEDAMFLSSAALEERFELFPEALETTRIFAERISCGARKEMLLMPKKSHCGDSAGSLRRKVYEGASKRYGGITSDVKRRIEYELDIIVKKCFTDYFLIVEDIVRQSPRTCGRGSGAASIVAYSLGITNVDPLRYHLMFERFLNPGRTDPPDIDIDFAWDERDRVLEYVFKTYGGKYTAMVATHQTCGARMAIREVARVYGLTEHEISLVTKKIPWFVDIQDFAGSLDRLVRAWPAFSEIALDSPWPEILHDAGKIIGLPRGIGTHCGGVLLTPCEVQEVVPVQKSAKGYTIVQWEKEGVEEMGLVKIDLLGNRSLAVIRDTINSLREEGIDFDEERWDPQSDAATQKLLADGRTIGIFYVESPAMRLLQRKSGKGDFDHLVIHSSIIRPAANRYIQEYLRRLKGVAWKPLHPLLEETLAETFGIMVYQEDVAKVAMALAGFTVEEADKLRKCLTKKGSVLFDEFHTRFVNGAMANGVETAAINEVWEMMESFRGYSFCKPHSASYVQVSFQSAWLKTHYPAHFIAAVLSNYGGFYTTQSYISEAMRLGLTVIPPDVNSSRGCYRASGMTILVGLCQIKGLSRQARKCIVDEREDRGDYCSVEDILERCGIDEKDAEVLIYSGACDRLHPERNRPELFWRMRRYYRAVQGENTVPPLRQISRRYYLQSQYRVLGFLTECHPITLVTSTKRRPVMRGNRMETMVGRMVALYGWCVTSKTVSTKFGDSMEFVTFEDETGIFETVFFPEVYARYSAQLSRQMAFMLHGRVTEEFGVSVLEVAKIERLQG